MIKHINSTDRKFQDVMTDNLVLDSQATEGSFNAITSDAVFRAVQEGGGGSSEIPEHGKPEHGKYLRVNDANWAELEWADVEVNLTGGDGISVENNTVAVKVGEGLHIATYRKTEDVNNDSYVDAIEQNLGDSSYSLPYILSLEEFYNHINNNSSFHLNNSWFRASTDFNDPDPTPFYWAPAIVLKSEAETVNFEQPFTKILVLSNPFQANPSQSTEQSTTGAQMVEGEADGEGVTFPITFDNYNQYLSNLDIFTVANNPENYVITLVLVNDTGTSLITGDRLLGWSNDSYEMAGTFSYQRTVRTRDALNVSNPVPTYSGGDSGKVLSVNGSGTGLEWGVAGVPAIQTIVASDDAARTITNLGIDTEIEYVLDPSKQFYVIGKQVSISFNSDQIITSGGDHAQIQLWYTLPNSVDLCLSLNAQKHQSQMFATNSFYCVNQAGSELSPDPSVGYLINKIVLRVDSESIDPSTGFQNDKLIVQLIG